MSQEINYIYLDLFNQEIVSYELTTASFNQVVMMLKKHLKKYPTTQI
jgi:hypothetical protein